jgi:hypothetical protein
MPENDLSTIFFDIQQRTDEQTELIQEILEEVQPFECELLGQRTVRKIAKGKEFESIEGGRHLNFTEAISLLALIASISQLVIFTLVELRKIIVAPKDQLILESKKIVLKKIHDDPKLKDLEPIILHDPEILDKILTVVQEKVDNLEKL